MNCIMLHGSTWISTGGDGMIFARKSCPVDYSKLCNQTVTVYHQVEVGQYTRTVHKNAYLDFRKNLSVDKTGSKEANSFLLILPGSTQQVFAEDKVLLGIGPEIGSSEEWRRFMPSQVNGLVVVSYVDPKYWNGQLVHTEAGG